MEQRMQSAVGVTHVSVDPTQLLVKSIQTSATAGMAIIFADLTLPNPSETQGAFVSEDGVTIITDTEVVQSNIDSAVFVTSRSVFPAGQEIVLTFYATPQYVAARRSFQTFTPVIALSVITAVAMIGSYSRSRLFGMLIQPPRCCTQPP